MRSQLFAPPLAAALVVLGTAVSASAAPPDNDTYPGRIVISSIPSTSTQDTTEATTDADDDELNAVCGAPAMDASVWYELTATADTTLVADVSNSDYSAGVFIATGSPGSFEVQACAPGAAAWFASAGETYSIVVIDDQSDGGGNGGLMELTVDEAPPPPEIDVTVNPTGQFTKTGSAIISGQVSCVGEAEFAFLEAELTQQVGRVKISGFGGSDLTCDGTTRPWSMEIEAFNGVFKGGRAASVTFAVACGAFDCGVDFEERIIQLSGRKR
jgi:hypothetical protein